MSLNIRSRFGMVEKVVHFLALPSIVSKLEQTSNPNFPNSENINQSMPDSFGVTDLYCLNFLVTEKTVLGGGRGKELRDSNLCPKVNLSMGRILKTNE